MPGDAKLVLAVLVLEASVGYPGALFAAIGHPVTWIGRVLALLERAWNQPQFSDAARRALGVIAALVVIALAGGAGLAVTALAGAADVPVVALAGAAGPSAAAPAGTAGRAVIVPTTAASATITSTGVASAHTVLPFALGSVLVAIIATAGLAQRSLHEHVRAVEVALQSGRLDSAREAVGRIVGRDTATLSAAEVSAAAIESLAESFNDAVVAPTFWLLVGGLPGLFAYKALNTADSMIGHIEPRWRAFGWAAARLDDVANLLPARIAGVLLTLVAARGFRVMWRDAPQHASPNAGWPEAAAAGALGVRLGGPACYDGVMHARPYFGDGAYPRAADVGRSLKLYRRACAALWVLVALIAIVRAAL